MKYGHLAGSLKCAMWMLVRPWSLVVQKPLLENEIYLFWISHEQQGYLLMDFVFWGVGENNRTADTKATLCKVGNGHLVCALCARSVRKAVEVLITAECFSV